MEKSEQYQRIASKCKSRLDKDERQRELLKTAIDSWESSARTELDLAAHYEHTRTYGNTDGFRYRAEVYATTANALKLELKTGVPHCNCHLMADCPSRIKTNV